MILYIDTTDFNNVTYALSDKGQIKKRTYKIDPHQSHETINKLSEFLKQIRNPQSAIKKIIVNKGPGSYTGVRVGVTHAMALGYALGIPFRAVAKEKFKII